MKKNYLEKMKQKAKDVLPKPVVRPLIRLWHCFFYFRGRDYWGFKRNYEKFGCKEPYIQNKMKWLFLYVTLGASAKDYFLFDFSHKKWDEIDEFVTLRRRRKFTESLNANGHREYVEDKVLFHEKFKEYTHRDYLDMNKCSYEQFQKFVHKHGVVIAKPADGFDGKGIFLICETDDIQSAWKKQTEDHYICEEVVKQSGILHEMNPGTCNTLRVNVFNANRKPKVINAIFRVGKGDGVVDNFHQGGYAMMVDVASGKVCTDALNIHGKRFSKHPDNRIAFNGLEIPCWNKVVELAKNAANIIDDVPYTSWDICVSIGGGVLIIEGNTYGNTDFQQCIDMNGKWRIYKQFWNLVKTERRLQWKRKKE